MHPHLGRSVSHLLLASTGWSQLALALASTSPSLQAAARVPTPDLAFAACQMALRPPTFNDTLPSKLTQACLSRWGVTSLYLCLRVFAPEGFATEGFAHQNHSCSAYLRAPLPPADIVDRDHFSDEEVARVRRLQREEATDETVLGEVVIPSDRLFWLSYDTLDTILYVHKYHFLYGAAVFVFWALVVLVGVLVRVGSVLSCARSRSPYQPLPRRTEEDDEEVTLAKRAARGNRLSVWLARYITVPATFGYRCAQNVDWVTIPPRVQSITILAFVLLNTAFCIHGYRSFPGNMYWPEVTDQLLRYVSDRTGIISFANFPVIWLFGMRNNLLMWTTGWEFKTFNNFHRWIARVATVQAVVHSVGYTIMVYRDGGWRSELEWWVRPFWWQGALATAFMCILLLASLFWIRRSSYELFLALHIALSVLCLVTMLGHVSIFNGRFDGFVWSSAVIWGADRLLRLCRVLSFNWRFWNTRALAVYDGDSNIVRLAIPYSSSLYQPRPGTYYYLHVLNDRYFWQSHPFTVASVTGCPPGRPSRSERKELRDALTDEVPLLRQDQDTDTLEPATAACDVAPSGPDGQPPTMTFLIRPYDSFTARLRDAAAATAPKSAPLRVLVDGPYGHSLSLDRFDRVLFVVGGSGIVTALSYMPLLGTRRPVHIVWAVRERALATETLRLDLSDSGFSVDVYVTGPGSDQRDRSGSEVWPKNVRVRCGKPDVAAEVQCACRDAQSGGSLAVVACGPARMADDARRAVVRLLGTPGLHVEYFEESFQW